MPDYSIKAPNGKTYRISGPAGASDAQVRAQVLKQYPDASGGAPRPAPAPQRRPAVPSMTRQQAVQETARRVVDQRRNAPSVLPSWLRRQADAISSGANNALLGLPGRAYSAVTGTPNDLVQSYMDELGSRAPVTNVLSSLALSIPTGGGASKLIGTGAKRLAASGAPLVARAGNYLQKITTFEKAKGVAVAARSRNVGRAAVAGGSIGAADAAIKDRDVATGATIGAVAAPVIGTSLKAVNKLLVQPAATALRLSSSSAILRKYIGTTAEEAQAALTAWRARAGPNSEPTLYEVLDSLKDREGVRDALARMGPEARDNAARLVRERGAAIGPEMRDQISGVTRPVRDRVVTQMGDDLTAARGGTADPADAELVRRASTTATAMPAMRNAEYRAIMQPHVGRQVADDFDELLPPPQNNNGSITIGGSDPQVSEVLRAAAGPVRRREGPQGVIVEDISDMIERISGDVNIPAGVRERALQQLDDVLTARAPASADALRQARAAYAARSRMGEGVDEGMQTRLRSEISGATNATAARKLDNAYDTPEGAQGRALGQSNRLLGDLDASPNAAIRLSQEISENPSMQRAITANLGGRGRAGEQIADAATAQAESARRLSGLDREQAGAGSADLGQLMRSLVNLRPGSLPISKANAFSNIADALQGIPTKRANEIVDALFSRNPTSIARAMKLLNNEGDAGKLALSRLTQSFVAGGAAANLAGQPSAIDDLPDPDDDGVPTDIDALEVDVTGGRMPGPGEPGYDEFIAQRYETDADGNLVEPTEAQEPEQNAPYGRQVISSIFPDAEITSDVRDPNDPLTRANPNSYHASSENAVDVRPIPGVSFEEFVGEIQNAGYEIIEARDEVNNPSGHATGPHWHVVVA